MREEELIKALKEMDKKRVEELEPNSRKLFDAIMSIADERDRLLVEKQELIDYLKEKIKEQNHKLKILDFGLDIVHAKSKIMTYEEILSKIEKE